MALLLRPKQWGDHKPPPGAALDANHPLSTGLANALLFNDGGGATQAYDSARGRMAAVTYQVGNPAWAGDGLLFHGVGSSAAVQESVRVDPGLGGTSNLPGPFTILASIKISGTTKGGIVGVEESDISTNGSANVRGVWLGMGNTSFDTVGSNLMALNEDVAWQLPGSAIVPPTNAWTQVALTFPGFSATASFFVNGLLKGTTAFGSPSAGSGQPYQFMVGGYFVANGSASRVFSGYIRYAFHWNRILTLAELEHMAVEPFAMFQPSLRTWAVTSQPDTGSGSISLAAAATVAALPSGSGDVELAASSSGAGGPSATGAVALSAAASEEASATGTGSLGLVASATEGAEPTGAGSVSLTAAAAEGAEPSGAGALALAAAAAVQAQPAATGDLELAGAASVGPTSAGSGDLELVASGAPSVSLAGNGAVGLVASAAAFVPGTASGAVALSAGATVRVSAAAGAFVFLLGEAEVEAAVRGVVLWSFSEARREGAWSFGSARTLWVFSKAVPLESLPPADRVLLIP